MKNVVRFDQGSIRSLFFKFAIPSIVGMFIVSMQMMIDGIFLSKGVGANGLAAVNLSMPLINTLMSIALMISVGGVVLTGIAKGQGDEQKAKSLTTLTFALFVLVLLGLSFLVILFFDSFTNFLGVTDEIYDYVRPYLFTMVAGIVILEMPIYTETFVRIWERPNMVFISGVLCCSVNVILDYLFILEWGMGTLGAAVATCIASFVASLALFPFIPFGKLKGTAKEIKAIFYNGSSEMLTTVSAAITTYVFNILLMKYIGVLGVSAMTIVFYVNMIVVVSLYGLSQALQPIVAYNVGAKRYDRIKQVLDIAFISGFTIGFLVLIFMSVGAEKVVSLFTKDNAELTELTLRAVDWIKWSYAISFINIIASSFLTAIERPLESAVVALGRSVIFAVAFLLLLPLVFGESGLWMAIPLAELSCLLITLPLMLTRLKKLKVQLS